MNVIRASSLVVAKRAASGVAKTAAREPNTFAFKQFKRLKELQRWHAQTPGRFWYRTTFQKVSFTGVSVLVFGSFLNTLYNAIRVCNK